MEQNKFLENFAAQFEDTDPAEITMSTNFRELDEWDSLMTLTIIAFVKTNYQTTINATEIRACSTTQELYNLILSKQ